MLDKIKSGMKIKKKTKNVLVIVAAVLISLFIYGRHNFENDKQSLIELKTSVANGDIKSSLEKMEEIKNFSNPLINLAFQRWKKGIYARFITMDEVIENTSGNKIVNDISNIYREYWREELLKENSQDRIDTVLYENIMDYLIANNLTNLTRDSLSQTIKDDSELTRILEEEGYHSRFIYRNGFQDLFIWNKETINNYDVILPKDTIDAKVIFIESYHLNGYDNYASIGSSQVGGWAQKESATLYCNKSTYDLNSEKFRVSYLKHESIHFTDLNDYPNLSSADLEYRAKVIELMYCTDKTAIGRALEFLYSADFTFRTHAHPYANAAIIKNLSKLIFSSEYESDIEKWNSLTTEVINTAAAKLYEMSEETLKKDPDLSEII